MSEHVNNGYYDMNVGQLFTGEFVRTVTPDQSLSNSSDSDSRDFDEWIDMARSNLADRTSKGEREECTGTSDSGAGPGTVLDSRVGDSSSLGET